MAHAITGNRHGDAWRELNFVVMDPPVGKAGIAPVRRCGGLRLLFDLILPQLPCSTPPALP
jgi:hypothetical protein